MASLISSADIPTAPRPNTATGCLGSMPPFALLRGPELVNLMDARPGKLRRMQPFTETLLELDAPPELLDRLGIEAD
ncbi:hypothetical protein [Halosimplex amylolyticum]|uniref:hypothetical protein n=1 Tax=Halosimplex amylolyticum TaxID=3396616 RepID=UPI003F57A0EE